jgi:hypothetical protein
MTTNFVDLENVLCIYKVIYFVATKFMASDQPDYKLTKQKQSNLVLINTDSYY